MILSKTVSGTGRRLLAIAGFAVVLFGVQMESAMAKSNIRALRVKAVPFSTLPGWKRDHHAEAFRAFLASCEKMARGRDGLARACRKARRLPRNLSNARARAFFESFFAPHKVYSARRGLLTGYYEPELRGSRVRTRKFSIPLYRRPADLVSLNSRAMRRAARRAGLSRKLTYAMKTRRGLKPYLTREQIERGGLDGRRLEMLWLADPVDAFFLHIQGSGRIVLRDGSRIRIGFDGKNGYDYTSVGKVLVRSGILSRREVTLENVKAWLRNNPEMGRKAMWRNKSFIFFRELPNHARTAGPIGAQGISLMGGRSLAVDRRHYRLGLPIFLSVPRFRKDGQSNLRRLMIAQDTGTAIRGARRGDIFWGSGDRAGHIAGRTYHKGDFYVLLPRKKPLIVKAAVERIEPQMAPKAFRATSGKRTRRKAVAKKTISLASAHKVVSEAAPAPVIAQVQLPEPAASSRVPEFEAPGVHVFSEYKSAKY